ncbi:glycosyltransferase family 2 protein, partial [Patescibacteria group bacterium]|nr:glycosyltransferase family 2 protein [Patescibacteria group bacterium]
YNEEKYISNCIKSIKNQTLKDFEIIVVDNGCIDKTSDIAKRLGCRVVKEPKRSLSLARNKGAQVSRGNFLCFVDADGILSKNWLKEAEKKISKDNLDTISGLVYFYNKNVLKKIWYNIYTFFAFSGVEVLYIFGKRLYLVGNNLVIKKSLFNELGRFKPIICEDFWLSINYWKLKNRKCFFNPRMLISYSSRGFDSYGYIKTILYWIVNLFKKTSQKNYSYKKKTWYF